MAQRLVIAVKGPKGARCWIVAAEDDDAYASAYYVATEDELRDRLGLGEDDAFPIMVEIQTSSLYIARLRGQVLWRRSI